MLPVPEPANHGCPAGPTILFLVPELAVARMIAVNPQHFRSPSVSIPPSRLWLISGMDSTANFALLPWENGYCESFNGKLRDKCFNGEIFYSLKEAQITIERWHVEYNTLRPPSSLGYRPPAPLAVTPATSKTTDQVMGCGNVETAARFPRFHTPDGGDGESTRPSTALH